MSEVFVWLRDVSKIAVGVFAGGWPFYEFVIKRWLDDRLATRLERFKTEQQTQIERLKADHQIEFERLRHLLSSRISKIHEKEFEILPKAWLMLHELHGAAALVLSGAKEYPDFEKWSADDLKEYLDEIKVPGYLRGELLGPSPSPAKIRSAMVRLDFNVAIEKHRILNNHLIEHRLFMTADLGDRFRSVTAAIGHGLTEFAVGRETRKPDLQLAAIEQVSGLENELAEIERIVKERLRYEQA